jgi:hypothetical protein
VIRDVLLRLAGIAAFVVGLSPARADDVSADPAPTRVRATIDGPIAHVSARFVLAVKRGRETSTRTLVLPTGAIVTAAKATVDGQTHVLPLTLAEAATSAFDAATAHAAGRDRAWVMVLRDGSPGVALDVAAPHDAKLVLELELDTPTCFARDARHVSIPESWLAGLDARLRRAPVASTSELAEACGTDEGTWFSIASRGLATGSTPDARIGTVAGRASFSEVHVARAELALASELGKVPADLRTAIVVDASRSLSAEELVAQRTIVAAYLAAAPRGSVQLIAYSRTARSMLEAWTPAAQAAAQIDRVLRTLTTRNGSNVDAGIAEAVTWLGKTKGTPRILVFSDERLPQRVTAALGSLASLFPTPPGTIVHTIALSAATGQLARFDDAVLAPLAAATTGIAVDGVLDETGHVDATILTRPISLDHVKLRAPGWQVLAGAKSTCRDNESISEGSSCTWWGEGKAASGDVVFEGLVWNRAFSRTIHPEPAQALALARLLSAAGTFTNALQVEVDTVAAGVNGVWSLYGTWGGSAGYADMPSGGGAGWGSICDCASPGTIGHGSGTGSGRPNDFAEKLRDQLAGAVAGCHADGARVGLSVETTLEEIVGVEVSMTPADGAVHDCIVEAVWNVPLAIQSAPSHATTALAYMH